MSGKIQATLFSLTSPYFGAFFDHDLKGRRVLILTMGRGTQFPNWFWVGLLVVRVGQPVFRGYVGFVYDD